MHPPLKVTQHPHCKEAIEALIKCHKENPVAKFWGVCTDRKVALDKCFREEKVIKRTANQAKAKEERERLYSKLAAQKAQAEHGAKDQ